VFSITCPGFVATLIKMIRIVQNNRCVKFNVRVDLPELAQGKNRPPNFAKLFSPQFITRPLPLSFDVTQFPHIALKKKDLVISASEEVR
jgi:hypothetical protein